MPKITQPYFDKTLNDVRSMLVRAGLAQAHVEEMCALILMELAIDYSEGSRVKASKYLIDLGYRLGARIRDPARTDIAQGQYKPTVRERLTRLFHRKSPPPLALTVDDAPRSIVESKPRIILPK